MCTVANFLNVWSFSAWSTWDDAGFSGTVYLIPSWWPPYRITWQSLDAGTLAPCTSSITVRKTAP